jgi:erythromycin esterase
MTKYYLFLSSLGLFLSCSDDPISAFSNEPELSDYEISLIESIGEFSYPISSSPMTLDDSDLAIFNELAETPIVALGEATHGTKEFFEMKHRIFQYLVENHSYRAFIFEIDFTEAFIFNDWIQGRNNEAIDELMRTYMHFWTWRTQEVKALFEWMKSYNHGRPEEEMIYFGGNDVQFNTYDLDELARRLDAINPDLALEIVDANEIYTLMISKYENGVEFNDVSRIENGIEETYHLLDEHEDDIVSQSSIEEFSVIYQLVRKMEQTAEHLRFKHEYNRWELRDQYMAENSSWWLNHLGQDAKIVLWAHNGHVARNQNYTVNGSQGWHLNAEHGRNYKVIGFGFARGLFTAYSQSTGLHPKKISDDPMFKSYTHFFDQAAHENFILYFQEINDQPLKNWLATTNKMLQLGSVYESSVYQYYLDLRITSFYDMFIFFSDTDHTVIL